MLKNPSIRNYGLPKRVLKLAEVRHEWLSNSAIQGIILDLDNTIISEDDRYFSPGAIQWIEQAKLLGFQFVLLSNGKRRHRARNWAEKLELPLINPAKKPLPFSFKKALKQMKLEARQVVVIGDSLHTDVIGAWWIGCPWIQVASLPHPPRWWERLVGRWVQIPYPAHEKRRKLGSPVVSTRGGKAARAVLTAVLMSVMMRVISFFIYTG